MRQAERGGEGIPIGPEATGNSRTELGVERVSTIPAGERPSPTSWRSTGWEASHCSKWMGTLRKEQICRKRDKDRNEQGGSLSGAGDNWKSQKSL